MTSIPMRIAYRARYRNLLIPFLWSFLLMNAATLEAQVNGYARVDNISGQTLSLTDVDESADNFEDGEQLIIMQMQDDVLGNTTNSSDFGDLGSIGSAGLWEVRTIDSHSESGGDPTSITLRNPLNNSYNIGSNSRVQIITFPKLGSPDYSTSSNMSAKDWNGSNGGVIAFEVPGTLTLLHDIDADRAGFRGGDKDDNSAGSCDPTIYRSTDDDRVAAKGEGIYRVTNNGYAAARGKILNGGGGGNEHNGGGAGGGNFSVGGQGGPGWDCNGDSVGGYGGISLSTHIAANRFFMGGGGGGGEGNNSVSTAGADGGGIVIIKADKLRTTSSCSGVTVSANGGTANDADNDGAGGGGAGGTLHFLVNDWNIDGSCPLTMNANGGDGGDVDASGYHAGGGGGGQGAVIQSGASPGGNTSTNTEPGSGGENCSGCDRADVGGGSNGDGVIGGNGGPLPVELLHFKAERRHDRVQLKWRTMSETNNDRFTVQRSRNGKDWKGLKSLDGAGTTSFPQDYSTWDPDPYRSKIYYRLRQTDTDGRSEFSEPAVVPALDRSKGSRVYPNPARERAFIDHVSEVDRLQLYDHLGKEVNVPIELEENKAEIELKSLPKGIYFLEFGGQDEMTRKKLVVE
jgi:hypothetical protein